MSTVHFSLWQFPEEEGQIAVDGVEEGVPLPVSELTVE